MHTPVSLTPFGNKLKKKNEMQSLKNIGTKSFFDVQQPRRNPVKHFSIFSVSKEGFEPP